MVTKTLTIKEDAYNILAASKLKGESFSEAITRLFNDRKKKKLSEFFGILHSDKSRMQKDLKDIKKINIELLKERLKRYETP